jgi:ketosteroid isomerase-like protein
MSEMTLNSRKYRPKTPENTPNRKHDSALTGSGCTMVRMASNNTAIEVRNVTGLIREWEASVQRQDMAAVLAHHSPDILMFDVPEPIQARGLAEYQETWELFFANQEPVPSSFRLHEPEVMVDGSLAVAHALLDVEDIRCRLTTVLRKIDGEWMFVHEHHSSPWPDPRDEG